ncbi:putative tail tubular protein A [Dickeya phage BF25/12]|uniref:Putative tail tubular protein A n=1 Tax=Dickeya phage BF25/12 TaxID=1698708 RepID=A0A219MH59_9CAUD|nr:tail protein [Dickeya phage BF25/12]ALA46505.1 putative tail tubular protein A [Dickeya phage BF25/12]
MELLEAINTCLTAIGETRVSSLDTRHPSVDLIKQTIATKQKLLLERGWWFNIEYEKMYPDTLKRVPYPADAIAIKSMDGYTIYSHRNGYLYDNTDNTSEFDGPVNIQVTVNLDFDDLPESAATVITYRAARAVYVGDFGNDSSVSDMAQNETSAMLLLEEQHLRNMKHSTRRRPAWGRYQNALSG